jgi:hypothetical protein
VAHHALELLTVTVLATLLVDVFVDHVPALLGTVGA